MKIRSFIDFVRKKSWFEGPKNDILDGKLYASFPSINQISEVLESQCMSWAITHWVMQQFGELSSSGKQMASCQGIVPQQETLLGGSYCTALQPAAPRSRIQTSHVVTRARRGCGRRQKSNKLGSHQLHVTHLTGLITAETQATPPPRRWSGYVPIKLKDTR